MFACRSPRLSARSSSRSIGTRRHLHLPRTRRLAMELCEPREMLAVFTVTSGADTGAVGELRWAVNSANLTPGLDEIRFSVPQVSLIQGELAITDRVNIDGTTGLPVLVKIQAAPNSRIFRVDDSNPATRIPVSMTSLELVQGNVNLMPNTGQGGAILNHERLTVSTSRIADNSARVGGGIANHGSLLISGSDVDLNSASAAGGGGIWNGADSVAVINQSGIRNNSASNGRGGGILNDGGELTIGGDAAVIGNNSAGLSGGGLAAINGATVHLLGGAVESNSSLVGAGLHIDGVGSSLDSNASVSIRFNNAHQGGGLAMTDRASADLRGSLVSGNFAMTDGGGVLATSAANATLSGVEITANQAGTGLVPNGRGGGLFASSGATATLFDAVVSYNGATAIFTHVDKGGGIFAGGGVNLTIESSRVSGNVAVNGGGVYVARGNDAAVSRPQARILYSSLENNLAYASGGGLFSGPGVDLLLKCATVSGNQVTTNSGGGLFLNGTLGTNRIDAEILDSTIFGNSAYLNGGGIASQNGTDLSVRNTVVSNNLARVMGGGLFLSGASDVPVANDTQIELSLISGNHALATTPASPNSSGGGIWAGNGATLNVTTTTIDGNRSVFGGGITANTTDGFSLVNSTVSNNEAANGAGVAIVQANATLSQDTFYSNRANRNGGGLFVRSPLNHVVNVKHSTLSLNSAAFLGTGNGGGVFVDGSSPAISPPKVQLDHTVVSGNLSAPLGGFDEIYDGGASAGTALVAARYTLVRDNTGTLFAPGNPDPNGNLIGTTATPIDAQLGPLGNNGGPTQTMLPNNASPAINRGDPLFTGPPVGDQRTLPYKRVFGPRIDMGATEVQPAPPNPDFNADGTADCADVNALSAAILAGTNNPAFDLTGDGFVNFQDMVKWLDDAPDVNGLAITRYLPGDANLSGVVDGSDFIIWNANKFTAVVGWCLGDFNVDGFVDGADFIIWNANKFTASPEPNGCGFFRGVTALHQSPESPTPRDAESNSAREHDAAISAWEAEQVETARYYLSISPTEAAIGRAMASESRWDSLLSTIHAEDELALAIRGR